MSKKSSLTVAVQAGGDALVNMEFMGERLIHRALHRMSGIADEIIVTTNKRGKLEEELGESVRIVVDDVEKKAEARYKGNSLEGIRTALRAATQEYVAIVAGDMPFPSANIIGYELALAKKTGADLVIPHTRHGLEPFCAVYRRDTCLEAIEKALAAGAHRCNALAKYVTTIEFNEAQALQVDPRGGNFISLSTPGSVKRMEQRVKKGKMVCKGQFQGEKKSA